jgi:hypothetical protein
MRYKIGCSIFSALIGFGRSKDRGKAGVPVWLVVQIFFVSINVGMMIWNE